MGESGRKYLRFLNIFKKLQQKYSQHFKKRLIIRKTDKYQQKKVKGGWKTGQVEYNLKTILSREIAEDNVKTESTNNETTEKTDQTECCCNAVAASSEPELYEGKYFKRWYTKMSIWNWSKIIENQLINVFFIFNLCSEKS